MGLETFDGSAARVEATNDALCFPPGQRLLFNSRLALENLLVLTSRRLEKGEKGGHVLTHQMPAGPESQATTRECSSFGLSSDGVNDGRDITVVHFECVATKNNGDSRISAL